MNDHLKLNYQLVEMLSKRETDINQHLVSLYSLVVQNGYKNVVELGAGQSSYVLASAVRETGGRFWSVDRIEKAHLRGFPEGEGLLENDPRVTLITDDDMHLVIGWATWIDFLFIDTNHQYDHTKRELYSWGRWVRVGGKIAMHDTFHKLGHAVDCRRALDEYLDEQKGRWQVQHNENQGGFSVLTKIKE